MLQKMLNRHISLLLLRLYTQRAYFRIGWRKNTRKEHLILILLSLPTADTILHNSRIMFQVQLTLLRFLM